MVEFGLPENMLGNGIEGRRAGAPCVAQISHGCGVVRKHRDNGMADGGLKVEETPLHSQQLPGIDGERRRFRSPEARSDLGT